MHIAGIASDAYHKADPQSAGPEVLSISMGTSGPLRVRTLMISLPSVWGGRGPQGGIGGIAYVAYFSTPSGITCGFLFKTCRDLAEFTLV